MQIWYYFTASATQTDKLSTPNKPTIIPTIQGFTISWDKVEKDAYYIVLVYDADGKVKGGTLTYGVVNTQEINQLTPNGTYTATVRALGKVKDIQDSDESEKSDAKKPLPKP